jgi:hypothetical protein
MSPPLPSPLIGKRTTLLPQLRPPPLLHTESMRLCHRHGSYSAQCSSSEFSLPLGNYRGEEVESENYREQLLVLSTIGNRSLTRQVKNEILWKNLPLNILFKRINQIKKTQFSQIVPHSYGTQAGTPLPRHLESNYECLTNRFGARPACSPTTPLAHNFAVSVTGDAPAGAMAFQICSGSRNCIEPTPR